MRRDLVLLLREGEERPAAKATPKGAGDVWSWMALDADLKLIVAYRAGGQDAEHPGPSMNDLASSLANHVRLTTVGHKAYLEALEGAFGADVDYAMQVRLHGPAPGGITGRYRPTGCAGIKTTHEGSLNQAQVSTFFVERRNLTVRMQMARFSRLSNAFSKHPHLVAVYTVLYNIVKLHKKHRMSPAMAADVPDRLCSIKAVAALMKLRSPRWASTGRTGRFAIMTKGQLKRRVFIVLLYLFALLAIALVDRAYFYCRAYDVIKDFSGLLIAAAAAYLSYCFSRRQAHLISMREFWKQAVAAKGELIQYTHLDKFSRDIFGKVHTSISSTIDQVRCVYRNVGENDNNIELFPFEPLHDMRRSLERIGFTDVTTATCSAERRKMIAAWNAFRSQF